MSYTSRGWTGCHPRPGPIALTPNKALAGKGLTTARVLAAAAWLLQSTQPDGGGSFRNAQSHCQAFPRMPSLTWNLCTSSRDWLSFWSASRMTSVSLWMMTSRGPCSSIGRLRSSCEVGTREEELQCLSPLPRLIPTLCMSLKQGG